MSGGACKYPLVITTGIGGGYNDAAQHSQCLYSIFAHVPGLKVVVPSNAYDAKGLMTSAIRDDNPVIFLEHKALYAVKGPVPAEPYAIPLGKAVTYSDIAQKIGQPTASRAVGAAVGRNPISFVVPCHRALGKSGALTGYHWGLTRKRAMLGWEAGKR